MYFKQVSKAGNILHIRKKNIILMCIPSKNYLELIEMIASKYELKYISVSP